MVSGLGPVGVLCAENARSGGQMLAGDGRREVPNFPSITHAMQQDVFHFQRVPGPVLPPEYSPDSRRKAFAIQEPLACCFPPWLHMEITWGL